MFAAYNPTNEYVNEASEHNYLSKSHTLIRQNKHIMKNNGFKKSFMLSWLFLGAFGLIAFTSCEKEEEPVEDPIASFQYEISEENPRTVIFTNFSQNAETYNWDFGDGNSATVENPTHTYEDFDTYEVTLTATNSEGVSRDFTQVIEVQDPFEALRLLAGETSKTWKLYRVGTSLGIGENLDNPRGWWFLENDGTRPCKYYQEFTFYINGDYVFDDKGYMWGEEGVFHEDVAGTCFEAIPANMVGPDGEDFSAWLGGTHSYEYDPATNMVTLEGLGAWMGLVKTGTDGEVGAPQNSVSFKIDIDEREGYDYMHVIFDYGWGIWSFSYAHYHDPSLEPDVVDEPDPIDDLDPYTPEQFFNTFASTGEEDVKYLIPTEDASDVTINIGVADPDDTTGTPVGEYRRGTNQYADLKFQMDFNIQFDNFTKVSLDVYVPSTNDFSGALDKSVMIWIADRTTTQNFWESWVQFLVPDEEVVVDEWRTYTFNLNEPSDGSVGTPLNRTDLDMVGLTIGGGGHSVDATFYIRNFKFE